ncbi:hypothetical protein ALMA_1217 [Alloscardovia macacae]|uniref:Uncharacterized protein n=1 Tax=Alloscardovia macacae TaxID=1160091 RepID=A0A261F3G0_9BIFI|nr:hypothetical protein ALMA_1217 [Alloscardovia macacae]
MDDINESPDLSIVKRLRGLLLYISIVHVNDIDDI